MIELIESDAALSGEGEVLPEREITFEAAYDRRDPDPSKDYGIDGCDCRFTLRRNGSGVTFSIFTNWMLPHVQAETDAKDGPHGRRYMFHKPMPADVSYHDTKPHYEGQTPIHGCAVTGGDCYSNGSGLMSEDIFTILLEKGSDGVWARLEELHTQWVAEAIHVSSTS